MNRLYVARARSLSAARLVRRFLMLALSSSPSIVASAVTSAARAETLTPTPPLIVASENRQPAGRLVDGVLTVRLEARNGMWYPEGRKSIGLPVAAFAEEGKPVQNPGPLV